MDECIDTLWYENKCKEGLMLMFLMKKNKKKNKTSNSLHSAHPESDRL